MNTNSYRHFFIIAYTIIIVIVPVACNLSVDQIFNPSYGSNNPPATKPPAMVTATQLANTPSAVPTETRTPNPTVTLTPLPTLPDFDRVLTFGGGGAGLLCPPFTDPPYSFFGDPSNFITGNLSLCIVLAATDADSPFFIQVTAPDGTMFTSNSIVANQSTQTVEWDGYPGNNGNYAFFENGNIYLDLYLSWIPNFLEGQWRIHVIGNSLDVIDDSVVTKSAGSSYIVAVGGGGGTEIVPRTSDSSHRPVRYTEDYRIGVIGSDFPPYTKIYVLLYRTDDLSTAELLETYSVVSDSAGFIETEIAAGFELEQTYYLIGITDPDTPLTDCVMGGCDYASDLFEIIP